MSKLILLVMLALAFSFACCSGGDPPTPGRTSLAATFQSRSDTLEQQYFIKRYLGILGEDNSIPLGMLVVNWGDGRLSGNTYYENQLGLLSFEGRLQADGSFILEEQRFNARNATFAGQFFGADSLAGTWWNLDSTRALPFRLSAQSSPHDNVQWTGAWHLNDPWDTATLIIGGVSDRRLEFAMNIYINGYRDYYFGTADLFDDTIAKVDYLHDDINTENCSLVFHRRNHEVYLEQLSFPFLCGLDHNCWIEGRYGDIYTGRIPRMQEYIGPKKIFRDSSLYETWLAMVGPENEPQFAYSMERIQYTKGWEEFHGLDGPIWEGRVRGFHREKEAIITYDKKGNMWAAVTTPPLESLGPMSVHYFTNAKEWKGRLPIFIENWMKDFRNCTVVYESANRVI